MRKLVLALVLGLTGLAMYGCGAKDAHDMYVDRNSRLTLMANKDGAIDDFHNAVLMDDRPSHLSFFIEE